MQLCIVCDSIKLYHCALCVRPYLRLSTCDYFHENYHCSSVIIILSMYKCMQYMQYYGLQCTVVLTEVVELHEKSRSISSQPILNLMLSHPVPAQVLPTQKIPCKRQSHLHVCAEDGKLKSSFSPIGTFPFHQLQTPLEILQLYSLGGAKLIILSQYTT